MAAISAAATAPISAAQTDPRRETTEILGPEWPTLGLTPLQIEVREVLKDRFLSAFDDLLEKRGPGTREVRKLALEIVSLALKDALRGRPVSRCGLASFLHWTLSVNFYLPVRQERRDLIFILL